MGAFSSYEEENAKLQRKVDRLRAAVHILNDEAEEWFGKYPKYKGHEQGRITWLLQRPFQRSISSIMILPKTRSSIYGISEAREGESILQREEDSSGERGSCCLASDTSGHYLFDTDSDGSCIAHPSAIPVAAKINPTGAESPSTRSDN